MTPAERAFREIVGSDVEDNERYVRAERPTEREATEWTIRLWRGEND